MLLFEAIKIFVVGSSPLLTLRQRLQVFDNVLFFLHRKAEPEARFVVIHDLGQCCESSSMIEAVFLVSPESRQRRSTIAVGWGSDRLGRYRCKLQKGSASCFPAR
jgi:hypothetical protein